MGRLLGDEPLVDGDGVVAVSKKVIRAPELTERIGAGEGDVTFSTDVPVAVDSRWVPGPLSHPYLSVSNCRTETTAEGDPGAPILGLPDCARAGNPNRVDLVFENLKAVAQAAGGDLDRIVKVTIYLTDLANFATVNTVMAEYFAEPYPARAAVGVASLPKGADVEAEAILAL